MLRSSQCEKPGFDSADVESGSGKCFYASSDLVTSYESEVDVLWQKPILVICNATTAGSAEVVAAAIQDYQRGIIVGDAKTTGDGTVQNFIDVPVPNSIFSETCGASNCTFTGMFRVTGNSFQHRGVTSNIVLPSLSDVFITREEDLENAVK